MCDACDGLLRDGRQVSYCPRCGRTAHAAGLAADGCGPCRREAFWNVAGVARVGPYSCEPLRRLLVNVKYGGQERCAVLLGELLVEALGRCTWVEEVECLVPVPMHWLRRFQRPCDHARLLAEAVSRRLGVGVQHAAVRRRTYAPSQTAAPTRHARFQNVRDCFAVRRGTRVADRCVCIIDNLCVTGATIHEVSKVLRRAGARRIYAAVAARSVLPGDAQAEAEHVTAMPEDWRKDE